MTTTLSGARAGTDLRVAVLGLGQRSTLARYAHRPGRGSRVVAVCDVDPGAVAAARARYGDDVRGAHDLRALLAAEEQLDAAFVLTPDARHEDMAVALLEAGVATYVEKPLAITVEGCDRILETARRTGTPLYVGHNMRHMPVVLAMRKLIRSGAIGEVKAVWCRHFVGHGGDYYFRDWHADRRETTGLLLQKGAHDLDVIAWLAGSDAVRVHAMGSLAVYGEDHPGRGRHAHGQEPTAADGTGWPPSAMRGLHPVVDVEDHSMVHLQLASGVLASYVQCHFTPDYWRSYTLIGTEGRLENFGDTEPGTVVKVWQRRSGYRADADLVVEVPSASRADGGDLAGHGGADPAIVAEFLRFVRDRVPTLTSPVAARQAVAAGCAATRSLREGGRPVDVAPLDPALHAYFADGEPEHDGDPEHVGHTEEKP